MEYFGVKPIENDMDLESTLKLAGVGKIEIRIAARVRIQGLVSNPELNGKFGWICGDQQSGRFPVSLEDQKRTISLKEINLVAVKEINKVAEEVKAAAVVATLQAAVMKHQKVNVALYTCVCFISPQVKLYFSWKEQLSALFNSHPSLFASCASPSGPKEN